MAVCCIAVVVLSSDFLVFSYLRFLFLFCILRRYIFKGVFLFFVNDCFATFQLANLIDVLSVGHFRRSRCLVSAC